jgi:ubiquinone/menaquinone biosynthesis C-methylase UbiE
MKRARSWRPRGRDWLFALSAGVLVFNAVRYRRRVARLARVDGVPGSVKSEDDLTFELVAVEGVSVPPDALEAATEYARSEGLDVLDIVPEDLDAERVIEIVRLVDPATYRGHRLAFGRGANHAILVERSTLERAGGRPHGQLFEADLVRLLDEAKQCAPTTSDLAVVAGVHAIHEHPGRRRAALRAGFGEASGLVIWLPPVGVAALLTGVVAAPVWGTAAVLAYLAQPIVVVGGTPLAGGKTTRSALRGRLSARRLVRTAAARDAPVTDVDTAEFERSRAEYDKMLAIGADAFFEPRRATCPWCGSSALETYVTCAEPVQRKPGTFTLDRCLDCRHVFQNPRLSLAGLDFYYRDFYDGDGGELTEFSFRSSTFTYHQRAEFARRHMETTPSRWLDVGGGHGHFCLVSAGIFEHTAFEVLDRSDAVNHAQRRGWVARAHQGAFPDLGPQLQEHFDVVSMFHYLEHTREPVEELRAAQRVLRPNGYLAIEVPDPECVSGRLFGRWWFPWFQPQHQHMIPIANLCNALDAEGFEVVRTERGEAHGPLDATAAMVLLLNHLAPPVGKPWRPPAHRMQHIRQVAVFAAGTPLVAVCLLFDQIAAPAMRRLPGGPNAYRLLARRRA